MEKKHHAMTIGSLAKAANVNIETIRYYQKMALLKEPKKPVSGFRQYSSDYIDRVCFIKRAQQLGFTLKQIQELLDLGDGHCKEVRELAEQKLEEIEARIKDLRNIRKSLNEMIKHCDITEEQDVRCALISSLSTQALK